MVFFAVWTVHHDAEDGLAEDRSRQLPRLVRSVFGRFLCQRAYLANGRCWGRF